ncbi:MAG: EAL domain-containing protein [Methylococcaceae bacterium]
MSLAILISIITRLIAMSWSLFLLLKLKDWRMGFFSLMLSMMATRQIMTLTVSGLDKPISFASNLDEIPALVVSFLALATIFFLNRIFNEHQQIEQNLTHSERRLQLVLDTIPARVFWKDQKLKYLGCNLHFMKDARLKSTSEIVDKDDCDFSWNEQKQTDSSIDKQTINSGKSKRNYEARYKQTDGSPGWLRMNKFPMLDKAGEIIGILRSYEDITDLKHAEAALLNEKERTQVTLASVGDAVITTDANGTIDYLNPAAEALTGWPVSEARGQTLKTIYPLIDEQSREHTQDPVTRYISDGNVTELANHTVLINREGKENAVQNSVTPIHDSFGKLLGTVLVFRDITEQRRLTKEITHRSSHDALTGLVNREEFECRVQRILENISTSGTKHALCHMDLKQFKIVNDTCGHAASNELLKQVSKLFAGKVQHRDTLGRLGGNEFGVLFKHCSLKQAKHVADEIRLAIEEFRFTWKGKNFRIGISIGLAPIDNTGLNVEAVMKAADSACYVAKENGYNRVHIYRHDGIDLAIRHRETLWVTRIQSALDNNHFLLYAQPIIPIAKTNNIGSHYEVLLRMRDAHGHLILPGVFMPAAERYQLAGQLDRWVITRTFSWLAENPEHLKQLYQCTINLSGQSLCDPDFEKFLYQQFDLTGLPGKKICFEITETAAIANLSEATRFIKKLKANGCRFALDDFGSDLSSLATLKKLPVDFLKIDGMFVKDIISDPFSLAMAKSINEIGQLMGKQTIAEGVENKRVFDALQKLGVDFMQGYRVGLPCPLIEMLSPTLKRSKISALGKKNTNVLHYHFNPTTNL